MRLSATKTAVLLGLAGLLSAVLLGSASSALAGTGSPAPCPAASGTLPTTSGAICGHLILRNGPNGSVTRVLPAGLPPCPPPPAKHAVSSTAGCAVFPPPCIVRPIQPSGTTSACFVGPWPPIPQPCPNLPVPAAGLPVACIAGHPVPPCPIFSKIVNGAGIACIPGQPCLYPPVNETGQQVTCLPSPPLPCPTVPKTASGLGIACIPSPPQPCQTGPKILNGVAIACPPGPPPFPCLGPPSGTLPAPPMPINEPASAPIACPLVSSAP